MTKMALQNIHLAAEEDDDLYSGYNNFNPSLAIEDLHQDTGFQQAIKTSYGRQHLGKVPGTGQGPSTSRLTTGYGVGGLVTAEPSRMQSRPMTAVRGAGYSSLGTRGGPRTAMFEAHQTRPAVSPLLSSRDEAGNTEEKLKALEKLVGSLLEESCFASEKRELKVALDKAKEAAAKEKHLSRQKEQAELSPNLDLAHSVLFNLAVQYTVNEMFTEALSTYQQIVKNRSFSHTGRLKVNMGNINFVQGNYLKAIKLYRMALDQVPSTHKDMRIKIMKNIGLAFVKLGQLTDAVTSFEYQMSEQPDFRAALHLVVCHYALGDREKMRRGFLKLLDVSREHLDDEDKYMLPNPDDPQSALILEAIKNDSLRKIERRRRREADWCILTAAKLISPVLTNTFAEGYEWCVQQIKSSAYSELANDLEINKAVMFLRKREFNQAIETLKLFERRDTKVASTASTNLSFLYLLQGELALASKYADAALLADHYNAGALVNKGNCCFLQGQLEKALQHYQEALTNEASCIEALYNLGLTYKKQSNLDKALECFFKLQAIVRNHPQVLYQLVATLELLGDVSQALDWAQQLAALVPTDPQLLVKMGDMWEAEGDKQQAFHCHSDSYRYFPSNISIIERLGAHHVDSAMYEKAITFFEKAAIIQPREVKWGLMAASCHRRAGNYSRALQTYRDVHRRHPDSTECLRLLVRLCTDLGLPETQEFQDKLRKAEKAKEIKEQRAASSGSRPGSRHGSSRLSRDGSAVSHSSLPASATPRTPRTEDRLKNPEMAPTYEDPIGAMEERPRTAAHRGKDDDFADEPLGEDLLPY